MHITKVSKSCKLLITALAITSAFLTSSATANSIYPTERDFSTSYPLPEVAGLAVSQHELASGDIDKDGDIDVVVPVSVSDDGSGPTRNAEILLNDGEGSFTSSSVLNLGSLDSTNYLTSILLSDLTGDDYPELIVGAYDDGFVEYYSNNSGSIDTTTSEQVKLSTSDKAATHGVYDLHTADINLDGYNDILWLAINDTDSTATLFTSTYDAVGDSFTTSTRTDSSIKTKNFAVGDIVNASDGTNAPDIAISHDGLDKTIHVFENDGTGLFTFKLDAIDAGGYTSGNVAIGNFNADGIADLTYAQVWNNQIGVIESDVNSATGYEPSSDVFKVITVDATDSTGSPDRATTGDINGDCNDDVVTSQNVSLALTLGDGISGELTFDQNDLIYTGSKSADDQTTHFLLEDFNGDGADDIFFMEPDTSNAQVFLSDPSEQRIINNGCLPFEETTTTEVSTETLTEPTTTTTTTTTTTPTTVKPKTVTQSTTTTESTTTTTTDPSPLSLVLSVSKKLKAKKAIKLKVTSTVDATVKITPTIKLGKKKIKLKAQSKSLTAGKTTTFTFKKLSGKNKKLVMKYLKRKRKAKISFAATAVGSEASQTTNKLTTTKLVLR